MEIFIIKMEYTSSNFRNTIISMAKLCCDNEGYLYDCRIRIRYCSNNNERCYIINLTLLNATTIVQRFPTAFYISMFTYFEIIRFKIR